MTTWIQNRPPTPADAYEGQVMTRSRPDHDGIKTDWDSWIVCDDPPIWEWRHCEEWEQRTPVSCDIGRSFDEFSKIGFSLGYYEFYRGATPENRIDALSKEYNIHVD